MVMENPRRNRVFILSLVILVTFVFASCTPLFWIKKYRDMPDIDDPPAWNYDDNSDRRTIKAKNESLEKYYVDHYGKRTAPKYEALPVEIDEGRLITRPEVDGVVTASSDMSGSGVKFTFVHVSDVQLRDEQVRLYDKKTSRLGDYIIPSFEHEGRVEAFDGAAYFAIVQTINATVEAFDAGDPRRPSFMIHTGDAIDAGVVNELYEFLYISNEVKIPWYNALGNHDVGTFGNIEQKMIYVNDPFVDFMTMHSKFNIINMHHSAYEFYPFVNVSPTNTGREATVNAGDPFYSKFNGFDRLEYTTDEISGNMEVCESCPGYYSIEVKEKDEAASDPAVQMIVLDTGFSFGAQGDIGDAQMAWLESEIENASDKITLVFGHHSLAGIKEGGDRLMDLFTGNPSVVAYICGHKHYHNINYYPGPENTFGVWEVITDAIFSYPQQGSLVRIKYEGGVGLLDVYAFRHTIQREYGDEGDRQESELYVHAELSYAGAVKDASDKQTATRDENRFARLRFPYPKGN
jgi:3',5'-cyclic AMP phosphodiesterase CpdA